MYLNTLRLNKFDGTNLSSPIVTGPSRVLEIRVYSGNKTFCGADRDLLFHLVKDGERDFILQKLRLLNAENFEQAVLNYNYANQLLVLPNETYSLKARMVTPLLRGTIHIVVISDNLEPNDNLRYQSS